MRRQSSFRLQIDHALNIYKNEDYDLVTNIYPSTFKKYFLTVMPVLTPRQILSMQRSFFIKMQSGLKLIIYL